MRLRTYKEADTPALARLHHSAVLITAVDATEGVGAPTCEGSGLGIQPPHQLAVQPRFFNHLCVPVPGGEPQP